MSFFERFRNLYPESELGQWNHTYAPLPGAAGIDLLFMGSVAAHQVGIALAQYAYLRGLQCVISAYSFDFNELVDYIIQWVRDADPPSTRRPGYIIIADDAQLKSGKTKNMKDQLKRLSDAGVTVMISTGWSTSAAYKRHHRAGGSPHPGLHHSRVMTVESFSLWGSANWSAHSEAGHDRCGLTWLTQEGKQADSHFTGWAMRSAYPFHTPPDRPDKSADKRATPPDNLSVTGGPEDSGLPLWEMRGSLLSREGWVPATPTGTRMQL